MRIHSLTQFNNNHLKPFGQTIQSSTPIDGHITDSVNKKMNQRKTASVQNMTDTVYLRLKNFWLDKLNNTERYQNRLNKAEILNKLALSYFNEGNVEKSAIILATSFNSLSFNPIMESDKLRHKTLVNNPKNLQILKEFYKTSTNHKARFLVMDSINELKSPYYLPVAEDILEFDKDTTVLSDKKTSHCARKFLHTFYNFNLLVDKKHNSFVYKNGALSVFDKWGTKDDVSLLKTFETDNDVQIKSKAKYIISRLKEEVPTTSSTRVIYTIAPIHNENVSPERLIDDIINYSSNSAFKMLKNQKYPEGSYNASIVINKAQNKPNAQMLPQLISYVGQTGTLLKHMDFVQPDENSPVSYDHIKAEAYYKILLRNNIR